MRILGLDTATLTGSVGLIEDEKPVAEYTLRIEATHSERVVEAIHRVLDGAGVPLSALDGFAVSAGPGSFTGLRIGLGVIKGLAMATGKAVAPVSSLRALVENLLDPPGFLCPMLDARKKEVYAALFHRREGECRRVTEDGVFSPGEWAAWIRNVLPSETEEPGKVIFSGDGTELLRDLIRETLGARAVFAPCRAGMASGVSVALLGRQRFLRGSQVGGDDLIPAYIQEFPRDVDPLTGKRKGSGGDRGD